MKRRAAIQAVSAADAGALLMALEPIRPPGGARKRILARLLAATAMDTAPTLTTVRATDGIWQPLAPGIERRVLLRGHGAFAFMLRLEAGARIPAHLHAAHEECVVVEGAVRIGRTIVRRGDFHFAPAGVPHTPITALEPALLYLRTAQ